MSDIAPVWTIFAVPLLTTAGLLALFGVHLDQMGSLTDLLILSTIVDAHALVFGLIYDVEYWFAVTLVGETHAEDIETVILILRFGFFVMAAWLAFVTIATFFNEDAIGTFFDIDEDDGIFGILYFLFFKLVIVFGPWIALPFVAVWQLVRWAV